MTNEGNLKILDFGVARVRPIAGAYELTTLSTASGLPAGTIPYMSPEQLRGEDADERSDIFSAGVVLYEMATGAHPFARATMAQVICTIMQASPVRASILNADVPIAFDRVTAKMMAKDPQRRYRRASEVDAALARLSRRRRQQSAVVRKRSAEHASTDAEMSSSDSRHRPAGGRQWSSRHVGGSVTSCSPCSATHRCSGAAVVPARPWPR